VIHNLDVNPTNRIPDKGTIIPRMILRSQTGCTIVSAVSFDRSFIELVYKLVICLYTQYSSPKRLVSKQEQLTRSRESGVLVLHDRFQSFGVSLDPCHPVERRLVA
jgi:hypothetical protein